MKRKARGNLGLFLCAHHHIFSAWFLLFSRHDRTHQLDKQTLALVRRWAHHRPHGAVALDPSEQDIRNKFFIPTHVRRSRSEQSRILEVQLETGIMELGVRGRHLDWKLSRQ